MIYTECLKCQNRPSHINMFFYACVSKKLYFVGFGCYMKFKMRLVKPYVILLKHLIRMFTY